MSADSGFRLDVLGGEEDAAALQAELAVTGDARQAALFSYELGRLALAEDDTVAAAEHLARCYAQRPQFRPALRVAQQLYRKRGDPGLVVKILEAEIRATRDPAARAALMRQQARLLGVHLGDREAARRILGQALATLPGDWACLLLLDRLHTSGDAAERGAVLAQQLECATEPRLCTALEADLALQLGFSDPAKAIALLQSAEEHDPGNAAVLSHLEHLFLVQGQDRELAETILRRAERAEPPVRRARLLARAARIYRDQLRDSAAAGALLVRAFELHPDFSAAADAFALLLAAGQLSEAAKVAGRLLAHDQPPAFQAAAAFQVAEHCRRAGQTERAGEWYRRCLKQAPSHQAALEAAVAMLEQADDLEGVLDLHRYWLGCTSSSDLRSQALYQMAVVQERLQRVDEAVATHRQALEESPGYLPSVAALKRIHSHREHWQELLALLDSELAATTQVDYRVNLLELMGSLLSQQLGERELAIECYRSARLVAPRRLSTLRALAALCEETERWQELLGLNEQEVALAGDPARKLELLQQMGEVWERRIGDRARAMACYERALELDSAYLPSLQSMGRLYQEDGRWTDLIRMHKAEVAESSDLEQLVYLLDTIAEIYRERLADDDNAAATYHAILEHKPRYLPALLALWRILEGRAAGTELAELLELLVDALADDRSRAHVLLRLGGLWEQLADAARAKQDYLRAARCASDSPTAWAARLALLEQSASTRDLATLLAALLGQVEADGAGDAAELVDRRAPATLLAELVPRLELPVHMLWLVAQTYQRLGMVQELCDALERMIDGVGGGPLAGELRLRLARARVEGRVGDPTEQLLEALSLPSGGLHALRALDRLVRGAGRQEGDGRRLLLLERLIEKASDLKERAILRTEIAEIHERTGEVAAAAESYRQALKDAPSHHSAYWGLARLLDAEGRWRELAELTELQLSVLRSKEEIVDAALRAALLWEDRVREPERAVPMLERVVALEPAHGDAQRRLRALLAARGRWNELAAAIESGAATGERPPTVDELVELARMYRTQLRRLDQARESLERALELDPNSGPALRMLADIHYDAGDWDEAASHYRRAEQQVAGEELAQVRRRLGEACLAAGRPEEALAVFGRALEHGESVAVLHGVARAAGMTGDAARQADALERLTACTDDKEVQIRALRQAAVLADAHLEDDQRAVRQLRRVLDLDPLQLEAIEQLAGIYGRSGDRVALDRHMEGAVDRHRQALADRPFDSKVYWQLGRLFRWRRKLDAQYCSYVALSRLGPLGTSEREFLQRHRDRCSKGPMGSLTAKQYESLVLAREAVGPGRDLLHAIGGRLGKLVGAHPVSHGLNRSHRVSQTVCDLYTELAAGLGITELEIEVWVSHAQPDAVVAEFFSGPALVVGERLADNLGHPASRFRLGRALCLLFEHHVVLQRWADVRVLLAALGEVAQHPLQAAVPDGKLVAEKAEALGRVLTRKDRRHLAILLPPLVDGVDRPDWPGALSGLARALEHSACRAGLVLAGDPQVALDETEKLYGGPRSSHLADLLRYVVSGEYFEVRGALQLAPETGG